MSRLYRARQQVVRAVDPAPPERAQPLVSTVPTSTFSPDEA